jgi:hypothetical protein
VTRESRYIEPADGVLTVFTDGSSLPGRRGGVGVKLVYVDPAGVTTEWDVPVTGVKSATNNEMELLAVITAMREIQANASPARSWLRPGGSTSIRARCTSSITSALRSGHGLGRSG